MALKWLSRRQLQFLEKSAQDQYPQTLGENNFVLARPSTATQVHPQVLGFQVVAHAGIVSSSRFYQGHLLDKSTMVRFRSVWPCTRTRKKERKKEQRKKDS